MSEQGKWTPGPWEVGYSDGSGKGVNETYRTEGACIVSRGEEHDVTVVLGGDSFGLTHGVLGGGKIGSGQWFAEMQANANLIAAAPELYEALERLLNARWMVSVDWCDPADYDKLCDEAKVALAKAKGESR